MKVNKNEILSRRQKIMECMENNSYNRVEDLGEELGVSLATIRRDLNYLEQHNMIRRFHGGAQAVKFFPERQMSGRDYSVIASIARKAAEFICDNDVVFLNCGITTKYILREIDRNVVAVTSNVYAMDLDLSAGKVKTIFTGGELSAERDTFCGQFTINSIDNITANICFLGVNAISVDDGLTSSSVEKITINNHMLERCSGLKIVVAEGDKIGKTTNFHVCPITKITHLITDASAPEAELARIEKAGVKVIVV